MNTSATVSAILIGFCYIVWPIVGKAVGAPPMWLGAIVSFISFVCMIALGGSQLRHGQPISAKAILTSIIVGTLNGIAVYYYCYKTTDKNIPTGLFIVVMSVAVIIFAPLLDLLFNGGALTAKKCVGVLIGIVAIWLVNGE